MDIQLNKITLYVLNTNSEATRIYLDGRIRAQYMYFIWKLTTRAMMPWTQYEEEYQEFISDAEEHE